MRISWAITLTFWIHGTRSLSDAADGSSFFPWPSQAWAAAAGRSNGSYPSPKQPLNLSPGGAAKESESSRYSRCDRPSCSWTAT